MALSPAFFPHTSYPSCLEHSCPNEFWDSSVKYGILDENLASLPQCPSLSWQELILGPCNISTGSLRLSVLTQKAGVMLRIWPVPSRSRDDRVRLRHEDRVTIAFFFFFHSSLWPLCHHNSQDISETGLGLFRGPEWLDEGMRHWIERLEGMVKLGTEIR